MKTWVILVLLYGVLKGAREPMKKAILRDSGLLSSLFVYTLIGFLMSVPFARGVFSVNAFAFFLVTVKSFVIFFAWMLSFVAIKKVPVSVYGLFDMSRVIFSTLLGICFLGESMTVKGFASLVLIVFGLYLTNSTKGEKGEKYEMKYVWITLLSCLLNAVSGVMDKYIMSTGLISASALQFWFMFILTAFYFVYILIKKEKIQFRKTFSNPWIYLLSFSLIFGDRLLFTANADPESRVTYMTLIKQSSVVVTILSGKLVYHEKNIARKLFCAGIIILGIAIAII